MTYELLVRTIKEDGSVQSYSIMTDQSNLDSCKECARLCADSCSFWHIEANVYVVVYINKPGVLS